MLKKWGLEDQKLVLNKNAIDLFQNLLHDKNTLVVN